MNQTNRTYCDSDAVKQKYMPCNLEDMSSKHVAEVPDFDLY